MQRGAGGGIPASVAGGGGAAEASALAPASGDGKKDIILLVAVVVAAAACVLASLLGCWLIRMSRKLKQLEAGKVGNSVIGVAASQLASPPQFAGQPGMVATGDPISAEEVQKQSPANPEG